MAAAAELVATRITTLKIPSQAELVGVAEQVCQPEERVMERGMTEQDMEIRMVIQVR